MQCKWVGWINSIRRRASLQRSRTGLRLLSLERGDDEIHRTPGGGRPLPELAVGNGRLEMGMMISGVSIVGSSFIIVMVVVVVVALDVDLHTPLVISVRRTHAVQRQLVDVLGFAVSVCCLSCFHDDVHRRGRGVAVGEGQQSSGRARIGAQEVLLVERGDGQSREALVLVRLQDFDLQSRLGVGVPFQ